ncbi:MAG: hypothetical protein JJT82_00760 [Legionellaceae bacterium]|nr:hypothetical protein [Legionellaceae bacterium]
MDIVVDEKNMLCDDTTPIPVAPFYEALLRVIAPTATNQPALAQLLTHYYQLPGQWIAITPIHWRATHNDAMIVAYGADLQLNAHQAQAYFKQFRQFWQDDATLFYHSPELWLLRVDNKPAIHSVPPAMVCNRSLMPILAAWDESLYWQRLFTEIQMFCASAQCEHFTTEAPVLNGLWFWGEGEMKPTARKLVSNSPALLKALTPFLSCSLLEESQLRQLPSDSIIALAPHDPDWIQLLSKKYQSLNCRWHWHNGQIETKPRFWWQRLWRALR